MRFHCNYVYIDIIIYFGHNLRCRNVLLFHEKDNTENYTDFSIDINLGEKLEYILLTLDS